MGFPQAGKGSGDADGDGLGGAGHPVQHRDSHRDLALLAKQAMGAQLGADQVLPAAHGCISARSRDPEGTRLFNALSC